MLALNISIARKNIYKLVEEINKNSSPVLLINKNGKNCYLVGEDDFNALLETIYLNSVNGLPDLIKERNKDSHKNFIDIDKFNWWNIYYIKEQLLN